MRWKPVVEQSEDVGGGLVVTVGHRLVDDYLEFLRARARPNTILAVAFDLKVFFTVVDKTPARVTSADVMAFITRQRNGGDGSNVIPIDRSAGLSARTVRRRVSSVSGFYAYLMVRGDTSVSRNPVPRGLVTRRERSGPKRHAPLIRTPVTLPKVLFPSEVDALVAALRTMADAARVVSNASVDRQLEDDIGVRFVAIPRPGKPTEKRKIEINTEQFRELVRWRTGAEGRIACLKRQHGWSRSHLTGIEGARTWCGHGVLAHNLTKIARLQP